MVASGQMMGHSNLHVRRTSTSTGLYDLVDLILEKGLVIDAYVRVCLVGLEVLTVDEPTLPSTDRTEPPRTTRVGRDGGPVRGRQVPAPGECRRRRASTPSTGSRDRSVSPDCSRRSQCGLAWASIAITTAQRPHLLRLQRSPGPSPRPTRTSKRA